MTEFVALYEQRSALNSLTNNEINLFFASVTATGISVGFLATFLSDSRSAFLLAVCGLLIILILLGTITFRRVISSRIQIFIYVRAMNRIRRYFAEQSSDIVPFLLLPLTDNKPSFLARGQEQGLFASFMGNSGLIAVINAALGSALMLTILSLGFDHVWSAPNREAWYAISAPVSFTSLAVYQMHFQNGILRAQDETQPVRFTSDPPPD